MGNDGGSIPKRDDLIKTKQRRPTSDPKVKLRQLYTFCALSHLPLTAPVVSCPLGKLYNKEAVIAHLLTPPDDQDNDHRSVVGHLRSLKDVTTLHLTPNPNYESAVVEEEGTTSTHLPAPFICPISLREMNGTVKFVYRQPGGAVVSESALKEMRKNVEDEDALLVCPVTGERYEQKEEWITIYPAGEEAEAVSDAWEARKVREREEKKAAKSDKKRKSNAGDGAGEKEKKKSKLATTTNNTTAAPSIHPNMSVPRLSATITAKLAAEHAKSVSPAIASLYAPKDDGTNKDKDGRSNWMTRGAFTRYA